MHSRCAALPAVPPWLPQVCSSPTCAARGSLLDEVAQLAVADEGALGVLALAVQADVGVEVALVHICRTEPTVAHPEEPGVALGTQGGAGTAPGHSQGLTNAGLHVQGCHEAVEAQAAVLAGDVGALPPVTDVGIVLTLINICREEATENTAGTGGTQRIRSMRSKSQIVSGWQSKIINPGKSLLWKGF